MRVCLGGTFEPFHAGHRAVLAAAVRGATHLFVGITDGPLAKRPDRPISSWDKRALEVGRVVHELGFAGELVTRQLTDAHGPAATEAYDRIVVSPESVRNAEGINAQRAKRGLRPLEVVVVPHVLAQDLLPISATAIHARRINREGRRLVPVQIAVGSANGVKVNAVKEELARILRVEADVKGFAVASRVPEQPRDDETLQGARTRAIAARDQWPGCDYAIGLEAGLIQFPGNEGYLEAQACVVVDRNGWETHGWGPAFHYPDFVTERALAGEMVSDILGPLANDPRIGSTTGAIGWLTDGRMDRIALSRNAILMAFVPRLRRELY